MNAEPLREQQHVEPPHSAGQADDDDARQLAERMAWVHQMRAAFSPEGMCRPDGEIDQDFFKPRNIVIRLKEEEKWGAPQREALYRGLERFGVGKWKDIIQASPAELGRYSDTDLRVHAARMLGSQSLARHVGWKGDKAAVDAQRVLHLRIAEACSCLKNGVLVENDEGAVARYLEENPEIAAQIGNGVQQ